MKYTSGLLVWIALFFHSLHESKSYQADNNTTEWTFDMKNFDFHVIPREVLESKQKISSILLSGNRIKYIDKNDFPVETSKSLRYLDLSNNLIYGLHEEVFQHMPQLEIIDLSGNQLKEIPMLKIPNLKVLYLNKNKIAEIQHKQIHRHKHLERLELTRNQIKDLKPLTFGGNKKLNYLDLSGNPLTKFYPFSLNGPSQLKYLNVRNTDIATFPSEGIGRLEFLDITGTPNLMALPGEKYFENLKKIDVTYSMHCCLFRLRSAHINHDHVSPTGNEVICNPKPDALNPCEDIFGVAALRTISWILSVLAILGNIILVVIMFKSEQKTGHRLLMINFGFSNLLIAFYLLVLVSVDAHSLGEYHNHAVTWQYSAGCKTFGFIAVFASSLSLCSLVLITVERYFLINYSLLTDNQLIIKYSKICISVAWIYSFIIGLLPVTDAVSSYTKTAICLPMDISAVLSKGYVIWLLITYPLSFVVVLSLYVRVFQILKHAESRDGNTNSDITFAKRVAVIIFSNYVFWLPISIAGFLAIYGSNNINVQIAKILLVFTLPLNATTNPILYAFFTKQFQVDLHRLIITKYRNKFTKDEEEEYRNRTASYFKTIFHGGKTRSETKTSVVMHCQQPVIGSAFDTKLNTEEDTLLAYPKCTTVVIDPHDPTGHYQQFCGSSDTYREDRSESIRGLLEDYQKQNQNSDSHATTDTRISLRNDFENPQNASLTSNVITENCDVVDNKQNTSV